MQNSCFDIVNQDVDRCTAGFKVFAFRTQCTIKCRDEFHSGAELCSLSSAMKGCIWMCDCQGKFDYIILFWYSSALINSYFTLTSHCKKMSGLSVPFISASSCDVLSNERLQCFTTAQFKIISKVDNAIIYTLRK